MHTQPMPESAGDFSDEKKTDRVCPKCHEMNVTVKTWESSCGGYEDYKYSCHTAGCGHSWWVEGIDS